MVEANIELVVIGAGFSGLGVACKLVRQRRSDFTELQRASTVGGTWLDHTYPDCACDIPRDLYSFSFRRHPDWSSNYATQTKIAGLIRGGDGVSLAQKCGTDFEAHRGTAVAGYPNLFLIVGPNTALGHNSIIYMIEAQVRYVLAALKQAERRGAVELAPTETAQRDYNRWLQKRLARSVWTNGGCSSYYLSSSAKNTTLWPERAAVLRRKLGHFDAASYRFFSPRNPVRSAIPTKKAVFPYA